MCNCRFLTIFIILSKKLIYCIALRDTDQIQKYTDVQSPLMLHTWGQTVEYSPTGQTNKPECNKDLTLVLWIGNTWCSLKTQMSHPLLHHVSPERNRVFRALLKFLNRIYYYNIRFWSTRPQHFSLAVCYEAPPVFLLLESSWCSSETEYGSYRFWAAVLGAGGKTRRRFTTTTTS